MNVAEERPCEPKRWYQCAAEPGESTGYAVLEILPCDASGHLLGSPLHLPLRPGRAGRRVIGTPRGCELLRFQWLRFDGETDRPDSFEIFLKPLGFLGAGWRLHKRLSLWRLMPGGWRAFATLLRCLFFPSTIYSRYEQTFVYLRRSAIDAPAAAELSEDDWPGLKWLSVSKSEKALEFGPYDWVVFRGDGDQWLQGGVAGLKRWSSNRPGIRVITFDELQVDERTGAMEPWLKPEWNLDFFFSSAYQGHSVAIRGDLVAQFLPELPAESRASADAMVDALLVAMVAHYKREFDSLVAHCPVLALRVSKPLESGISDSRYWPDVRSEWLKSALGVEPTPVAAAGRLGCGWRIRWPLPETPPLISLCIPTRNGLAVLKPCLDAILNRTSYPNFEVLVVDNQSDCSETLDYLSQLQAQDSRVRVIRYDQPFNFSAINNYAVAHAHGELVGIINNDIEPRHSEWLTEMASHALRPDVGCVGAKLYYPNGRIQHGGVVLGIGGVAGHAFRFEPGEAQGYQGRLVFAQNYSAVTAACLLVRKSLYEEVGGLDERLAVNYNDVDFCLKVKALGYRNIWTPHAELIHHESFTRGGPASRQKRKRAEREFRLMRKRWGELLNDDPAYHPKLTRVHEDFSLGSDNSL